VTDFDFSNVQGDFKKSFSKINRKIASKSKVKKVIAPENREVIVQGTDRDLNLPTSGQRIITPAERKVVVLGEQNPENYGVKSSTKKRPVKAKKKLFGLGEVREKAQQRQRPPARPTKKKVVKQRPVRNPDFRKDVPIMEKGKYQLRADREKKINKVIVPDNKKVIVEGVNKFILSQQPKDKIVKNIGYYQGKKLNELVLTFNNNSALDFDLEIFNPSMPLDYLYSTSLNLNDKVKVAGGEVSYTDVLFNLLANPTMVVNCKYVFSGPNVSQQKAQPLKVQNQSIEGVVKIHPLNLDIEVDTMQVASDIVFFDIMENLNRPFIPDGMDFISYKVLAGNTVTMAFFYEQISLKKVFYDEARKSRILL
jgi:hypothetical protein